MVWRSTLRATTGSISPPSWGDRKIRPRSAPTLSIARSMTLLSSSSGSWIELITWLISNRVESMRVADPFESGRDAGLVLGELLVVGEMPGVGEAPAGGRAAARSGVFR